MPFEWTKSTDDRLDDRIAARLRNHATRSTIPTHAELRAAADRLAELDAALENVRSLNESLLVAIRRRDESLAELNEDLTDAITIIDNMEDYVAKINALLPPCPTCGGNRMLEVRGAVGPMIRCPDCKDHPGKVSIEQVVATYNAVWDDKPLMVYPKGGNPVAIVRATKVALRQVKP